VFLQSLFIKEAAPFNLNLYDLLYRRSQTLNAKLVQAGVRAGDADKRTQEEI
jgi:hypothetical protein